MPRSKPCPICGAPPSPTSAPFCSRGCRDRDLMRWLEEGYAIPAAPGLDADGLDTIPDGD